MDDFAVFCLFVCSWRVLLSFVCLFVVGWFCGLLFVFCLLVCSWMVFAVFCLFICFCMVLMSFSVVGWGFFVVVAIFGL